MSVMAGTRGEILRPEALSIRKAGNASLRHRIFQMRSWISTVAPATKTASTLSVANFVSDPGQCGGQRFDSDLVRQLSTFLSFYCFCLFSSIVGNVKAG